MLRFPPCCCSALVLVLVVSAAQAQPKPDEPKPAQPGPGGRFSEASREDMARLVFGVSTAPSVGGLQALTLLEAIENEPFRLWRIEPPLLDPDVLRPLGATVLFLSGAHPRIGPPLTGVIPQADVLFWFYLGDKLNYFALRDTNTVPKLPDILLQVVKDERGIPEPETAELELDTYLAMLRYARHTAMDAFFREARPDVGYTHLMNQPRKYRGDVILIKGTLRLIKKYDAPLALRTEGVPHIYEGWLFANGSNATPVCILFTELPPKTLVEEKMNRKASFAGYFLKKYRYTATDQRGKEQQRIAPLLIGRMPLVTEAPPEQDDANKQLLPAFLILVVGTLFGVLALTLWFRYHDRRVRLKLDQVTRREFVLPAPENEGKIQAGPVTNTFPETTENWLDGSETPPTGESALKLGGHNRLPEVPPS